MSDRLRLILLSFTLLLTELALIRWTGANVMYLSYFSNFILLGSFLGIGIGFLRARREGDGLRWAPVALAALVAFVSVFPVEIDRSGSDVLYFGRFNASGLPIWVTLPVVFAAAAAVMALLAEGVARVFERFEPLEAYRLDILGAILGIAAFSVLSFLHAPPLGWGLVVAVLLVVLLGRRAGALQMTALVALVGFLAIETFTPDTIWSPYYEITTHRFGSGENEQVRVDVNGIPHQAIESTALRRELEPIYFLPYERRLGAAPRDVLVVGAGNGSDVAIALAEGAERVDAVEIDPRLQQLGRDLHPDRPYHDDRVTVHVDDGRAFLERTDRRYDLILFALPDSLTLVSGQSSLRLESYLFTREAIDEARAHLAPGGVFAMYNYYRQGWLIDRLARTLHESFGQPPCIDAVGSEVGLALLTASDDPTVLRCPSFWAGADAAPPPVQDDRPFLYLRTRRLPGMYLFALALILAASVAAVRVAGGPLRTVGRYLDLFFMGAAFLLLETMYVVQFALLFGTTWFVNALVFTGVLLAVYLAIEVAKRVRFRAPARLYVALAAAFGIALAVPQHVLLELEPVTRFAAASTLAFAPIFLANLVFAQRFKHVGASTTAFGANLLGAMLGGLLEYGAIVVGYRALLVAAGLLYGLAFLTGRHHLYRTTTAGDDLVVAAESS
ncbi:MAG: spermidine synthase [Actinomycetota bacterium]|nr:spermidine synthase [Actinomycetota bacterium]